MKQRVFSILPIFLLAVGAPMATAGPLGFAVHNISSDQLGVAAIQDPNLVNGWGLISSDTSPLWIAANGTGTSLLYNGTLQTKLGLVVSIPGNGTPTGIGFNGSADFNGDAFLFDSEDGTVSGWRGALGTTAETLVLANAANVYKGLADASVNGFEYAYLANFRNNTIDVLKGNPAAPGLTGNFVDPSLPAGYAPFNIMNLGGTLFVSYAVQDAAKHDEIAGSGLGIVSEFDLQGKFIRTLVPTGGNLNAPWGMAIAPSGFDSLGGDLIVGNFGDGQVNAYSLTTGMHEETLPDTSGNPLMIDGLWGLRFGNGMAGGPVNTLFFAAGPDDESHGLFGTINAVPEPGTWMLAAIALVPLAFRKRRAVR